MDFLRPEFEESLAPSVDRGVVTIGRFTYTGVDIINLAGEEAYRQAFSDWLRDEWLPTRRDRRDELLYLNNNESRYYELKGLIAKGSAIPFVGSGMSCPTGMPTWEDFLRQTSKQTKGFTVVELSKFISGGDFETPATRIFGGMPPQLFNERFEGNFSLNPGKVIAGAVRLLPFLFDSIVITTNFDPILEHLYGINGKAFDQILYGMAVGDFRKTVVTGARCLLKIHGNFADEKGRVLLQDEYDRFYSVGCGGRDELTLIFRRGGLVFLGCSLLNDRTMKLLKEIADADKNMPRHYAFMQRPKANKKVLEREHFLAERNIFPIWYDGSHDVDIEALLVGLMEDAGRF